MHNEIYEDINIRECIRTIIKKKYFILVILLLFLFIGFSFPKNKKAITYLKVDSISKNELYNIAEKIEASFYGNYSSKIEASNPGNSQLLKITASSRNYQAAISDLEKLSNLIILEDEKELEKQKIDTEKAIKELEDEAFLISQDSQDKETKTETVIINSEIIRLKNLSSFEPSVKTIISPQIHNKSWIYSVSETIIWGLLGIFISFLFIFAKEWWNGQKES